ncbi:uncharacterized protein BJ171DRAFT_204258 [Polychytrium aggregatum]|uniref:uncharacterized protein n=1 Tax=Polychytrium aggregatum TaxID=110093 RepID=UPI0022FE414C|nr:uncharacterized protein BJ171DRAFT_204258 [Polychytrium aggregatum]KAI9199563.1 hypothetical protein BJ171DRAFT_204258 [Polychytrium aggregatum]
MDPLQKLKRTLPSTGVTSSPHYDPKKLEAGLLMWVLQFHSPHPPASNHTNGSMRRQCAPLLLHRVPLGRLSPVVLDSWLAPLASRLRSAKLGGSCTLFTHLLAADVYASPLPPAYRPLCSFRPLPGTSQLIKDKKQLQDVAAIQKEEINRLQSQELKLRAELLINKDENSYLKDENVKLRQLVKALTERLTERMAELSSTLVSRATPTTLESLGAIEVSADVPTTEAPSLDHPQLLLPIPGVPEELASEDGGVDRKPPLDDTDSA